MIIEWNAGAVDQTGQYELGQVWTWSAEPTEVTPPTVPGLEGAVPADRLHGRVSESDRWYP